MVVHDRKPCPFCGEKEFLAVRVMHSIIWKAKIACQDCGAEGPVHFDGEGQESAIDGAWYLWNDRV